MQATLQNPVLVLNRLWQAVNVCSVQRAITLLCAGHAQVVYEDEGVFNTFSFKEWCDFSDACQGDDVVRTISIRIPIPRIIVLAFFDRLPNKDVKFTRHNVFERDKYMCQYCGVKYDRKNLNIDHIIPRMRGGRTTWKNVVCSCIDCNRKKGSRTPEEAGMRLVRKPRRPKWRPFMEIQFRRSPDLCWRHFIDFAYWNVEIGDE